MSKPLTASALNKVLAFGLAVTLVVWTFGVYFVLPAQAVDAHIDGTVVLSGGTVFKIMGGQRLGYPTPASFLSYNYQWNNLVPANSADLALPQGNNVKIADGALINDGGTVFLLYGGQKYGFTSAAVFTGLGYKWSSILTDSLSAYPQGANVDSTTMAHPSGTLVNASGTIFFITSTGRAGIPTPAVFYSWGFDFAKVVPANAADLAKSADANLGYRVGSVINDGGTIWGITSATGKRGFPTASCYTDLGYSWTMALAGSTSGYTAGPAMCGESVVPPASSTGTLTVSLASDTPPSGIVIKGSARAPFTKIALTASGGDVVVDSWVMKRVGVGQDGAFSSVDIVDLSTNAAINDSGKTFSSEHTANFTENLTIPSGTTKYVMLAGNMANVITYSGETPALSLQSITLVGGTVNGSFPITGSTQTINTTITIGTATVQRGAYSNATTTTLEVGKTGYALFSFSIQAGAVEDVTFQQVKLYQVGTASLSTDLKNIKLYRDGTFLADGVVSGSFVNFNFTAETLPKGQTKQYQVKADVVSGSARTIQLAVYRTTDMLVTGTTYLANITPTFSGTSAINSGTVVLTDNQATISNGTLRIGRSSTVGAENISVGNSQVLGAFEFEAKGEPIIVSSLALTFATSTSGSNTALTSTALQSIKVVDKDGKTVAGPTDPTEVALPRTSTTFTVTLSDTFTVPVGLNVYKVVGNLATNGNWANNEAITVSLTPSSATTAKGDTTGQSITASPTSSVSASTQTIKASSLTVTKNSTPTAKTIISNSSGVLAGSWTFDATNSGEDIRITTIGIGASSTGNLTNATLKQVSAPGGTVIKTMSPANGTLTASTGGTRTLQSVTSTFALSDPIIVTKGTSQVLDLYVDVSSGAVASEQNSFSCNGGCLTAYGVTTGNSATITSVNNDGALLTVSAAGTLTINLDSSAPALRMVVFGSTGVTMSEVRLKATSEAVKITKLNLRVADGAVTSTKASGDYTQLSKVYLKLDGAVVGDSAGYSLGQANTEINISSGIVVPEGTTGSKLSITGDLVNIGTNQPGSANQSIKVGLNGKNGFTANGTMSNSSATKTYNDSTGTAIIMHKSMPVVSMAAPSGVKLTPSGPIHRTTVTAVGGTVGLYKLAYQTTTSTGLVITAAYLKLVSCTACGGIADGTQLTQTTDGTFFDGGTKTYSLPIVTAQAGKNFLQIASGATATIDLYATVTGFTTGTDSVSTSLLGDTATSTMIANGWTGGAPAARQATNANGNFVWSDLNADDTDSTGHTTAQWYNGYYVSGLGSTTTSTAATVSEQ